MNNRHGEHGMRHRQRSAASDSSGFTLIELLITIAIIGIIGGIATFGFSSWLQKSRVEAQVRQLMADIGEIRMTALTTKRRHSLVLDKTRYSFYSYSSSAEPKCSGTGPGGKVVSGKGAEVKFPLKKNAGTFYAGSCDDISGDTFEFDERGMLMGSTASIYLDYTGGAAALDCLSLHTIRVNPGKTNGANCDDR